ncbi:MAG TPA: GGDEF domain-containing protein, partial [bacterium]|nr:GGDEF domain-containing protein [bacterium]
YLEKDKPIDDRERRIYAIFAKRLEDVFDTVEILRRRDTAEKNLRRLSLTDELTGIHNRRGFMMLARQHLRLSKRLKKRSILMYMDVDNMKWINDNLGHSTGDEALIEVASILRKTFRKSDVLARIGGDEFVFLGLETEKNNPGILVERIRRKLDARNSKKTSRYPLSLSIGLAVYDPDSPVSLRDLIEEADKRMYQEKMAKKNLAQING